MSKMARLMRIPLALLVLNLLTVTGFSQVYDAASEFSTNRNPTGVWSYGVSSGNVTNFVLFNRAYTAGAASQFWSGPVGEPFIAYNPLNTPEQPCSSCNFTAGPHQLFMHPGQGNERAVLRWTAPQTGYYRVETRFEGIGSSSTVNTFIRSGTVTLYTNRLTGFRTTNSFSRVVRFQASDSLDVSIDYGSNGFANDSVAVSLVLTKTEPVPTTLAAAPAVILTVDTMLNGEYQLQYATELAPTTWINSGPSVRGIGGPMTLCEQNAGPKRFYRVVTVN